MIIQPFLSFFFTKPTMTTHAHSLTHSLFFVNKLLKCINKKSALAQVDIKSILAINVRSDLLS